MKNRLLSGHNNERGQTIILVAISLLSLLAMAALAIDVVTLYVARSEAQRTANAAAIAGAKVFATSAFTSLEAANAPPSWAGNVCLPVQAEAQAQIQSIAGINTVGGQSATAVITCNLASPLNPQVTVVVNRTGLPTFFARIWGRASNSISATATAEAYNPSGLATPVQSSVKPWLVPNCDPTNAPPPCNGTAPNFVNSDGTIPAPGAFIGQTISLYKVRRNQPPVLNTTARSIFYAANIPTTPAPVCPSTSAISCDRVGSSDYLDNIACSSQFPVACGQPIGPGEQITVDNGGGLTAATQEGTQCAIHASGPVPPVGGSGLGQGQDVIPQPASGNPISIKGGDNNPNVPLRGIDNISRSDSVITVPIYDVPNAASLNLCPGGACNVSTKVVGFLQLAIQQQSNINLSGGVNAGFTAVIVNVAGCSPGTFGSNTVSGGGISPVPVRLINQ
jgi:hypothetical protein